MGDAFKSIVALVTNIVSNTYLGKVILEIGLVTALHNISEIKGGKIGNNVGSIQYNFRLTMTVFNPAQGELLTGTVTKISIKGLQLTTGFFKDIYILAKEFKGNIEFDSNTSIWSWVSTERTSSFEVGYIIRFRVTVVKFPKSRLSQEMKKFKIASNCKLNENKVINGLMVIFGSIE